MPHHRNTVFFLLLASFSAAAAVVFFSPPHTDQELLANYAKAKDFWDGFFSVGGWPWWTPNFLGGTSLAPSWGFMTTNLWLLIWTSVFGVTAGSKLALASCIPAAAASCYLCAFHWTGSRKTAAASAFFYAFSPGLLVRIAAVEHLVVACSMAVLPLSFYGLLRMAQAPSPRRAVLAAASVSLLALTYSKLAIVCAPVLFAFWFAETHRANTLRSHWKSEIRMSFFLPLFFLGVVPLLPSLRETTWLAFFEFSPFLEWQRAFCSKSAFHLFDRMGFFSEGFAEAFAPTTAKGGTFLGSAAVLLLLVFSIWKVSQNLAHTSRRGLGESEFFARASLSFALFCFWLSFGPYSVAGALFRALRYSVDAPHWSPLLLWGSTAALVWLIFWLVPPTQKRRHAVAAILAVAFLFVPGFRLLERLFLFQNIRAPFDFYQIPGPFFIALASGVFFSLLFERISSQILRFSLVALGVFLLLWDTADFFRTQWKNEVSANEWSDFEAAENFLATSPLPGSVMPISGRYFYLLTPFLSGRPLAQEAFQLYLQQRGFAALLLAGSVEKNIDALRLAGVGLFLRDSADQPEKKTGDAPPEYQNATFQITAIPSPLSPGFVGKNTVQAASPSFSDYQAMLQAVHFSAIPLEHPALNLSDPTVFGSVENGKLKLASEAKRSGGSPWVPLQKYRKESYEKIEVTAPESAGGWMVLTQAWHPDWIVEQAGSTRRVFRAFGALPAFEVSPGETVTFRFSPPSWYPLCAWASVFSWLALALFFLLPKKSGAVSPSSADL